MDLRSEQMPRMLTEPSVRWQLWHRSVGSDLSWLRPIERVVANFGVNQNNFVVLIGFCSYAIILETTPAPTVRPPSRMAKRIPFSIATG